MKKISALLSMVIGAGILVSSGCQGEDGENGKALEYIPDVSAPIVSITSPEPGHLFYFDTDTVKIEAYDIDGLIDYVTLFVNGNNLIDDEPIELRYPPYSHVIDFEEMGISDGLVTLSATAYDTAGNSSNTPLHLHRKRPLSGLDSLYSFFPSDSISAFELPYGNYESLDIGSPLLGIIERYATKFVTPNSSRLIGMLVHFMDPAIACSDPNDVESCSNIVNRSSFWTSFHHLTNLDVPGEGLDSVQTFGNMIIYNDWSYVPLQSMNNDASFSFDGGDAFALSIRCDSIFTDSLISGLVLTFGMEAIDTLSYNPTTQRSYQWDTQVGPYPYSGWGTLWERDSNFHWYSRAPEFRMISVIEYIDGSIEGISPHGKRVPISREDLIQFVHDEEARMSLIK